VLVPLLALIAIAARGSGPLWPHLISYVLPQAALQTALLLCGTGVLVVAIGTGTAWLVSAYRFPGRSVLAWVLLLPLAMPAYIVAYAYLDVLHPAGTWQSWLRDALDLSLPLPDIRSLGGAVFLFGFVLYPYVYGTARASFLMQSADVLEAARLDGASGGHLFRYIALPLARPAIAAGAGLALMETLGDIGACEFLGVQTLTVSVYVTWVTRGSVEGAAQIALAMLVPVALLLLLERRSRPGRAEAGEITSILSARPLGRVAGALAAAACAVPVILGFVAPALHLALSSWSRIAEHGLSGRFVESALSSAQYATIAAILAVAAGFALACCQRFQRVGTPLRLVQIGYALPGTVIAVGLLGVLSAVDAAIGLIGIEALRGALLLASPAAVILAYLARFLAVPASAIEAGYEKLPFSMDDAARVSGARQASIAFHIHWPLLRPATRAAFLVVFVECIKELPATLLLRPLNTETLATFLYGEASRGVYEDGAVAALAMVGLGMLPILLLSQPSRRPSATRASPAVPPAPDTRPAP